MDKNDRVLLSFRNMVALCSRKCIVFPLYALHDVERTDAKLEEMSAKKESTDGAGR